MPIQAVSLSRKRDETTTQNRHQRHIDLEDISLTQPYEFYTSTAAYIRLYDSLIAGLGEIDVRVSGL